MKKRPKESKLETKLKNSFINYLSDLFVATMVIAWIVVIIIMVAMAIYSTITICDTSVWSNVTELVGYPLTAGGALWLVKCCIQHKIANENGKQAHMDFPKVDVEDIETEEMMFSDNESEEELG